MRMRPLSLRLAPAVAAAGILGAVAFAACGPSSPYPSVSWPPSTLVPATCSEIDAGSSCLGWYFDVVNGPSFCPPACVGKAAFAVCPSGPGPYSPQCSCYIPDSYGCPPCLDEAGGSGACAPGDAGGGGDARGEGGIETEAGDATVGDGAFDAADTTPDAGDASAPDAGMLLE
jgi:hypothetical protein